MKFNSRKDALFTTVVLATNALVIASIFIMSQKNELGTTDYLLMIPLVGVVILLFWIFFGTGYTLSQETFTYRSGPFKDSIPVDSIREVIKGKTLWVGTKPATARKGLIIKYNKYDEVYISPATNDSFIQQLLAFKQDVKISDH